MPLSITTPTKVTNNVIYPDSMPNIGSAHVSISRVIEDPLNPKTSSIPYVSFVYGDRAYIGNRMINLKTQTTTVMTFSTGDSNMDRNPSDYITPDLKGLYRVVTDVYGTYKLFYCSFDDGSMTLLDSSDSNDFSLGGYSGYYNFFIGDGYIIYPKNGDRMDMYGSSICKVYKSYIEEGSLLPTDTEIASLSFNGNSNFGSNEVSIRIDDFYNDTIRFTLQVVSSNLNPLPRYFYNEYNIRTKKFWAAGNANFGYHVILGDGKYNSYRQYNSSVGYYHVPYFYVDREHFSSIAVYSESFCTSGLTVVEIPNTDYDGYSSGCINGANGSMTFVTNQIITQGYGSIVNLGIVWRTTYEYGCYRTDKTPNGYYFVSSYGAGTDGYALYYIQCIPNKGE